MKIFAVTMIISCNMLAILHGNIKGKDVLTGTEYCYVK